MIIRRKKNWERRLIIADLNKKRWRHRSGQNIKEIAYLKKQIKQLKYENNKENKQDKKGEGFPFTGKNAEVRATGEEQICFLKELKAHCKMLDYVKLVLFASGNEELKGVIVDVYCDFIVLLKDDYQKIKIPLDKIVYLEKIKRNLQKKSKSPMELEKLSEEKKDVNKYNVTVTPIISNYYFLTEEKKNMLPLQLTYPLLLPGIKNKIKE